MSKTNIHSLSFVSEDLHYILRSYVYTVLYLMIVISMSDYFEAVSHSSEAKLC